MFFLILTGLKRDYRRVLLSLLRTVRMGSIPARRHKHASFPAGRRSPAVGGEERRLPGSSSGQGWVSIDFGLRG